MAHRNYSGPLKQCPLCGKLHDPDQLRPLTLEEIGDVTELMITFVEHLRVDLSSAQPKTRDAALAFLNTQAFYDLVAGLGQNPDDARSALRKVPIGGAFGTRAVYRKKTRCGRRDEAAA